MKNKNADLKDEFLRDRFFQAVINGELGVVDPRGVVVTLKEFKMYFNDIKTQYVTSFLPAATLEPGRYSVTHTKYLKRINKGVYLLLSDAIDRYIAGPSDDAFS